MLFQPDKLAKVTLQKYFFHSLPCGKVCYGAQETRQVAPKRAWEYMGGKAGVWKSAFNLNYVFVRLQHLADCLKSFGLMLVEKNVFVQSAKWFPPATGPLTDFPGDSWKHQNWLGGTYCFLLVMSKEGRHSYVFFQICLFTTASAWAIRHRNSIQMSLTGTYYCMLCLYHIPEF